MQEADSISSVWLTTLVLRPQGKVPFQWGRMVSCAAIANRRRCRLPIATQLVKLPHKKHLHAVEELVLHLFRFGADLMGVTPGLLRQRRLHLGDLIAIVRAVQHKLFTECLSAQVIVCNTEAIK